MNQSSEEEYEIIYWNNFFYISHSKCKVRKAMRLNTTNYFIMKIHNKRSLLQIRISHSSDIDFKDFSKKSKLQLNLLFAIAEKVQKLDNEINPNGFQRGSDKETA